jgi:levansucrase
MLVGGTGLVTRPAVAAPVSRAAAQYDPGGNETAVWNRADALKVRQDPTNTSLLIPLNFPIMNNEVWVWDTWPLTNLSTNVITYNGWHVIFSLTAPRNIGFNERHAVARIGFFYSRDARTWI